ncbi:MAG: carboxypeptidase regulatory-like domain-containing protein [Chitinophagaceae bacterium]|nr:carboxypeptidase regulatory-like domain-containing protein [Chitinophagaceae bacterium]
MKKTFALFLAICVAVVTLHAFRTEQASGIKGSIVPADATISNVWAISGVDTVKVQPVKGSFALPVKPGIWRVIIDATEPFKDAILESVEVKDGQITDVGEIKLPQ